MRQDTRQRYPWNKWLDGQPHEHTALNARGFRNYLYEYAKRNGVYVNATIDGASGTVRFQFFDEFSDYEAGRRFKSSPPRNGDGKFQSRTTDEVVNRQCNVCGKDLTPVAPENATECYRFDFVTGVPVAVHQEEE